MLHSRSQSEGTALTLCPSTDTVIKRHDGGDDDDDDDGDLLP